MKSYIVGVGMTKFEKPETRDWQYWDMAEGSGHQGARRRGDRLRGRRAGPRRLLLPGVHRRPAGRVRTRPHRRPRLQRQQQLRHRLDRADDGAAVRRGRHQRLRTRPGLREDEDAARSAAERTAATSRRSPVARHYGIMAAGHGFEMTPPTAQIFGNAAREHMERHGTTDAAARRRGRQEPPALRAQPQRPVPGRLVRRRDPRREDRPPSADQTPVLAHLGRRGRGGRRLRAVRRPARAARPGRGDRGPGHDHRHRGVLRLRLLHRRRRASRCPGRRPARCTRASGLGIEDVDVIELHDCFSVNELLTYEALGMCADGESGKLVESGATTYGGQWVVNPSGGLISKGHPLGATGLAQAAELTWQLRGEAGGAAGGGRAGGARAQHRPRRGGGGHAAAASSVECCRVLACRLRPYISGCTGRTRACDHDGHGPSTLRHPEVLLSRHPLAGPPAPGLVVLAACAGQFLVVLDVSVVNVALPVDARRPRALHQRAAVGAQRVLHRLRRLHAARRAGRGHLRPQADLPRRARRCSPPRPLAGGLAQEGWQLLAARAVQGLGAAVLAPATLTIVTAAVPPGPARTRAIGTWTAVGAARRRGRRAGRRSPHRSAVLALGAADQCAGRCAGDDWARRSG